MQRFNHRVLNDDGTVTRWVSNPTITVYVSGSVQLAQIYDDDANPPTAKANPFTGPSTGLIHFYAADGKYDVVISSGSPSASYQWTAELLDDTLSLSDSAPGISTLNALTAATQTFATGTAGTDFAISSSSTVHTFNLPSASASSRGALLAADWAIFNAKIGSLNGLTVATQTLAIGASGNSPSWSSAGSVHTLHLPIASNSVTGIVSATDYSSFSAKEPAISPGNILQYFRGDKVFATLNTSAVVEASSLYYTDARARAAVSATSPLLYVGATGIFSIQQATGAQAGYLSSADWTTFNTKIGSLNGLAVATQTFATGTANTDFTITSSGSTHTFDIPIAAPTVSGGKVTNSAQSFSGPKTFSDFLITNSGRRRSIYVHTASTAVTMVSNLEVLIINKTVGAATAITLPSSPSAGQTHWIIDGKGDAAAQNITITPAAGTVNGAANLTITANYGWRELIYSGQEWLAR